MNAGHVSMHTLVALGLLAFGSTIIRSQSGIAPRGSPVRFTDITGTSGIDFRHSASPTSQKYLIEALGGGVAMLDYDNDGRLDLFFTNGAQLGDAMRKDALPDKRDPRYWNRLYRQKADGTFEDVTESAGVKGDGYSMGVAAADYNNDGWVDLYVTGFGSNTLYRNNGDGTFTDVTRQAGVTGGGWSTSAAWLDYDRDGRLDLFVARYVKWDFEIGSIFCGERPPGFRAHCGPQNFKGTTNLLYHQRADGSFEEVSVAAGIADPNAKSLGVALADIDGDGWIDVVVANDGVRQSLYHNRGNGAFEEIALPAAIAYNEHGSAFAGMGVDAADYDEDGHPDVVFTALSNETYPLFRNNGDNTFLDSTSGSGVATITFPYTGWGVRFVDVDNDGFRDIVVSQGHVGENYRTSAEVPYKQPLLLMRNTGKAFVNISAAAGEAFQLPLAGRGLAVGDLNNDGQPDVVIATLNGPPVILRNEGTANHWIGFALTGTRSNRSAIGARVMVTRENGCRRIFDVSTAGSYLSSNDPRLLVGLGTETGVRRVEIRWPSGQVQVIENPLIDRYHVIREGASILPASATPPKPGAKIEPVGS